MRELLKWILKLSTFSSVIVVLILVVKKPVYNEPIHTFLNEVKSNELMGEKAIYFIGSSRVQNSIDQEIVRNKTSYEKVYNAGVYGSTFLSNCILAEYLLSKKTEKTIFFELSPILDGFPDGFLEISEEININPYSFALKHQQNKSIGHTIRSVLEISNEQLFSSSSLTNDLKRIIGRREKPVKLIGYNPSNLNTCSSDLSFLTKEDVDQFKDPKSDLTAYQFHINRLNILAKKNNSEIIFFLPITNRNIEEKEIIIPLYNSISAGQKMKYSDALFNEIRNPKYLKDNNHLNEKGAKVYSEFISNSIAPFIP